MNRVDVNRPREISGEETEEVFEVEGMTLLSWTTRIEARDEAEALAIAERLADWTQASSTVVKVETLSHRVASCRLTASR